MRFPAFVRCLVAAFFSMLFFAAGPVLSAERYTCKPTFPGLCKTVYTGDVSSADAEIYIAQSRELITQVTDYPEVHKAHYYPNKGLLVLEEERGHTIRPKMLSSVARLFIDRRLRIDRVVSMTPGMHFSRMSHQPIRDTGGRSRFYALAKQTVTADGPISEDGRRAIRPMTEDVFGNIRIDLSR